MTKIPVWMDCDTGTDDAVAIMLAHWLEGIDLKAISAVCGNTTQQNAWLNTQRICRLILGHPHNIGRVERDFRYHIANCQRVILCVGLHKSRSQ